MEVLFSMLNTSRKPVESETYIEKRSFPTSECYFIGNIFTATNFDLRHYAPSEKNTTEGNYQCGPTEM